VDNPAMAQAARTQAPPVRTLQRRALDARHLWKWTTLAPLIGVVVVFVLTVLDPLGFENVTKSQSEKIFYKIYAAVYPTTIRDNVSVVLLDNKTIEETFNDSWPPSHLVHRRVLEAILTYHPTAVLVDMFFFHRNSKDDFKKNTKPLAAEYSQNDIPLLLTVATPGTGTYRSRIGLPEMEDEEFINKVTLVSAELEGEPGQPPLYPLTSDSPYEPAAVGLYHAICKKAEQKYSNLPKDDWFKQPDDWISKVRCPTKISDGSIDKKTTDAGEVSKDMEVVWGLIPAHINCLRLEAHSEISKLTCNDFGSTWIGRAIELLWVALLPPRHRDIDPMAIPYHSEISTTDLLKGENRDKLKDSLRGKVVIYSSRVGPTKDFVLSPVHGNIDGAFIHAMAVDNLLTWGEQSIIRRAPEGWFYKDWTEFQPTILMAFAALLIFLYRRYQVRPSSSAESVEVLRHRDERFLKWASRLLYSIIIVVGLYEFFVLRIAPFNWLGLLIVVHIAHRIDRWFFYVVEHEADEAGWSQHDVAQELFEGSGVRAA
jgi:CHASE2 domain-containing sensor protein